MPALKCFCFHYAVNRVFAGKFEEKERIAKSEGNERTKQQVDQQEEEEEDEEGEKEEEEGEEE